MKLIPSSVRMLERTIVIVATTTAVAACSTDPPSPPDVESSDVEVGGETTVDARETRPTDTVESDDGGVADIDSDTRVSDTAGDAPTDGGDAEAETAPTVARVDITPAGPHTLTRGETKQLEAQVRDTSGNEISCPGSLAWSSTAPSVVSISQRSTQPDLAEARGVSGGSAVVRVTCNSASETVDVRVESSVEQMLRTSNRVGVWLKPSEIKSSNRRVAEWPDASANGLDFTGGMGTRGRPKFVSNAIAGHAAARFEGGEKDLDAKNRKQNYVASDALTLFFVVKNRDGSHTGQVLSSCGVGNNQIRFNGKADELYVHASNYYRDETFEQLAVATTQWHLLTVVLGSSSVAVRQNGSPSAKTSVQQKTGTWEFNQIGNRCSAEGLKADVAEVVVFETELSSSDRNEVESYLMNKYNL